jgi:glyoxylase-like metal-dependent hydrolase (beta-lactamase superfamily II)
VSNEGPQVLGITTGAFVQNSWLVWDPASRDAVLVDAGEGHQEILAAAAARELTIRGIWLTHAHIDHVLGLEPLRRSTGAPVWLHPDDLRWYNVLPEQGRMFGIEGLGRLAPPEHELHHGDVLRVGRFAFEVRHVPGHAPGHVAFVGHGLCLSGDVLFEDSIGRTDLAGGNLPVLMESIRREVLTLPDATRVLPGHGSETTVGRERQFNPFLQAG